MSNKWFKDYLTLHPDATLDDAIKAKEEQDSILNNASKELKKKEKEFWSSLIGKCFLINFNGCSKRYCKISKELENIFEVSENINVYYTKSPTFQFSPSQSIEINRTPVYKNWIKNPYKDYGYSAPKLSFTEITEEQYNEVKKMADEFKELNERLHKFIS